MTCRLGSEREGKVPDEAESCCKCQGNQSWSLPVWQTQYESWQSKSFLKIIQIQFYNKPVGDIESGEKIVEAVPHVVGEKDPDASKVANQAYGPSYNCEETHH